MATNTEINGKKYYRIYRKVGLKRDSSGAWTDRYKNFYGRNKAEAEAKYNEYMNNRNISDYLLQPLGAAIECWLLEVFDHSALAPTTKHLYKSAYFRLMANNKIASEPVHKITPLQLQTFYNNLKAPFSQVKALHKCVRKFFKYVSVNYHIPDITVGIELHDTRKLKNADLSGSNSVTTWNIDELRKVLNNLKNERLALLIILAINTGARIGELLALQYSDIRAGQLYISKQIDELTADVITIRPPKTANSYRSIPLTASTLKAIRKHKAWHLREQTANNYQTDFIFTTASGRLYCVRNVYRALDRYYKRIGVTRHRFHDYRHTFATMLSGSGTPIEVTSALLGHSSIEVTAKYYIGISDDRKQAAIDALEDTITFNSFLTASANKTAINSPEKRSIIDISSRSELQEVTGSSPVWVTKRRLK